MRGVAIGLLVLLVSFASGRPAGGTFVLDDLVRNDSFEVDSDSDGIPDFWKGLNLGADDRQVNDPFEGGVSFKFAGLSGARKALRQDARTHLPPGTRFFPSAWSKMEDGSDMGGRYAYQVNILYQDGSTDKIVLKFPLSTEWSQVKSEFTFPKLTKRITFALVYSNQTGMAWFDQVKGEVSGP